MKTLTEEEIRRIIVTQEDFNSEEMTKKFIPDNESSRKEFEDYMNVWEKSADVSEFDNIDAERDWQKLRTKIRISPRRQRIPLKNYLLRIAAVLILALGLAYMFTEIVNIGPSTSSDYIESFAEVENTLLELPDGSRIYMNKNTKIIRNSEFGNTNRDIILEGEGFFEVSRNESLPFKVHTLNSTVEVLGTSFNVKSESHEVTVGVLSGKVAFYLSEEKLKRVELEPNNTGKFNTANQSLLKHDLLDANSLAWHTGEFKFEGTPVNEVCETVADYFNLETKFDRSLIFSDHIHLTLATASLPEIIFQLNNTVTEDLEIIATSEMLIIRKK